MPKKHVQTAHAPKPMGPYSQGVIAGGLLFVSGQIPIDPKTGELSQGDIEAQTELVLKNIVAVLKEAKMGPENVVKTTVFLADLADLAEAKAAALDLTPPVAPSFAEAEEAAKSYTGFARHVFPRCFVCGPQRASGDGLRIFPGSTTSQSMVASPWVPDPSLGNGSNMLRTEFLWAAVDCTSGFAVMRVPKGNAIVLGELCVRIDGGVTVGEKCVVIGWPLQIDGRKRSAGSAVFASSGRPVAVGRATG